ncbi:MAG: TonB-dependent receptor [Alphaproteobacteria bacterium]|nr:TonB-dependent receptor [Alphaproteobacteria bacterium]MDE2492942.1 TonB-dependent receptor [Alphaproteobacteria bacterium]
MTNIMKHRQASMLLSCAVAAIGFASNAQAQANQSGNNDALMMETVVVTGTSTALKKFDTSYSISTLNSEDIQLKSPTSIVDLMKGVPGVRVENSGGEGGGENTVIRGLPYAGFRMLDMLVDGLPLFESNYERQLQIDEVYRVDLGTQNMELVRGGTAPIYSTNASGGVVNFITNHGTDTQQSQVSVATNGDNEIRVDGVSSGPISNKLLYAVSGFYRQSDGQRDPGFTNANRGGQIQLGGTYIVNEQSRVTADIRWLQDEAIFYSAIPLRNPYTNASLAGLIDPHYGTLTSASERFAAVKTLDGHGNVVTWNRDLQHGIHPRVVTATLGFDYDDGNGWSVSDKLRYTNGNVSFDAIFNGSPTDAAGYLSSRWSAALAAFPTAVGLRYTLAGTNTVVNPATTQNLVMSNTFNSTNNRYEDLINDLRVNKTVNSATLGNHDLVLGVNLSKYNFFSQSLNNALLNNVKNQPDLLDIQAVDGGGNVVGMVTDKGFIGYGTQLVGSVHGVETSIYASETWHTTDALQFDIGARYVSRSEHGNRGVVGSVTSSSGPLATRSISGLTGYSPYVKDYHATSWTVGSFYKINDDMNVFVRFTNTFSLPKLSDMWTNNNCGTIGVLPNCAPVPVLGVKQAEVGFKANVGGVQVFLTGFWSHLSNFNNGTQVVDTNPLSPTYQQLVNQNVMISTTTKGIELEAAWHPVEFFALEAQAVFQNPIIDGGVPFNTGYSASNLVGMQQPRAPRTTATLQPQFFFDIMGRHAQLYATAFYQSTTYQDNIDTGILPAYGTLDVGGNIEITDMFALQIKGSNLTNSNGLTEGNARGAVSGVASPGIATVGRPVFGRTWSATLSARF